MILNLFESSEQRRNDDRDLQSLYKRYGDEIINVLAARAEDQDLRERDRKHWARLLRKARSRFG